MSKPREHVAHRWAHNKDPKRTGTTNNMSFEGMKAYSYNTIVAVKYPNSKGDGGTCIFVGEGIYNSTTTMKHKSKFFAALPPGWVRITADLPPSGYPYGFSDGELIEDKEGLRVCHKHMVEVLKEKAQNVKDAKSYSSRAKRWKEFIWHRSTLEKLSTFLRLKVRTAETFGLNTTEEDLNLARWDAKCAERPAYNRPSYARPSISAEMVENWRAHGTGSHMAYCNNPIYLRLSKTGEFVQTSANAHVPVRDAEKLFLLCKKCKMRKKSFFPEDQPVIKVGTYQLLDVNASGDARVGCHELLYDEMERLYTQVKERREQDDSTHS